MLSFQFAKRFRFFSWSYVKKYLAANTELAASHLYRGFLSKTIRF